MIQVITTMDAEAGTVAADAIAVVDVAVEEAADEDAAAGGAGSVNHGRIMRTLITHRMANATSLHFVQSIVICVDKMRPHQAALLASKQERGSEVEED